MPDIALERIKLPAAIAVEGDGALTVRTHAQPSHAYRTPFARDTARILHARAFRRLAGKTQVFSRLPGELPGDHSRSRLTHTVARMETEGLVSRSSASDDRRGVFAELTESGWERLKEAAPTHVAGVRSYLLDPVSPEDFAAVGRAFTAVAEALGEAKSWPLGPESPKRRSTMRGIGT